MKQLRALVPVRLAPALAALMAEAGAAAVDTSPETEREGVVWVTAYCEDAQVSALRKRCESELTTLARRLGFGRLPSFETREVRADWETSWTQLLPPSRLAPGLVLVAEGVDYHAAADERVLRLEPGLYFGFGEHPTTQLISAWIGEHCTGKTVLDVGCGTGVLSFVAAHANANTVHGIDIDVPSVASAQRNADKNALGKQCTFSSEPLEAVSGEFEVVLANIDAKTLALLAVDLCRVLSRGGQLALTGVLDEQAVGVRTAFAAAGIGVDVVSEREGWVLLANAAA